MLKRWGRRRPNVVIILMDGLRPDWLGSHPVFEELAQRGALYTEMFTYAPYTLGSVHAILSGLYGTASGVNAYFNAPNFDRDGCYTLAQYLRGVGYATRADLLSTMVAPHQGFDEVTVQAKDQEEFIERHRRLIQSSVGISPFFLYLHYSDIHTQLVKEVIEPFDDFDPRYFTDTEGNRVRYARLVTRAGDYLSAIWKAFEDAGVVEETCFVILSDHGCSLGERVGEKVYGVFTYDYTLRVFAYLIAPRRVASGRRISEVVRTVDVMPTILELVGVRQKSGYKPLDGQSLLPLVLGQQGAGRMAFAETGGLGGPHPSTHAPNVKCVRTNQWKFIHNVATGQHELYEITKDRDERHNVIEEFPEIASRLWGELQELAAGGTQK